MGGQERLIDDDDLFVVKIIVSYYGGRGGIACGEGLFAVFDGARHCGSEEVAEFWALVQKAEVVVGEEEHLHRLDEKEVAGFGVDHLVGLADALDVWAIKYI